MGILEAVPGALAASLLGIPLAARACSAAAGVPAARGLAQHPAFSPEFYSEGEIWSKGTFWVVGLFASLGLAEGKHFFSPM